MKTRGHNKKKKAYIAQEGNAFDTSSSKEQANFYLMVDGEVESAISYSEFKTKDDENYDQLLDASNEMHEKAHKLSQATTFSRES